MTSKEAFELCIKICEKHAATQADNGAFMDCIEDIREYLEREEPGWDAALDWAASQQEPVAWLFKDVCSGDFLISRYENTDNRFPVYLHPAPIPEGWLLDLMDAVRREGAKKTNAEILAAAPEYKE
jgi:hypothetical protein